MKKYFYLLSFFILAALCSNSQNVPNGDFENWTVYYGFSYPNSWRTTDSIGSTQGQHSVVSENTPANVYSGSYAMKMQSWTYSYVLTEPGVAANGANLNTTTFQFQGGTPDTVRHDMLTGWYKYSPSGGDSCSVSVFLFKRNGSSRDTVAVGIWSEKNTVSTYTQFTVQLTYRTWIHPDSVLIVIASGPIGVNSAHAGTVLYIDDLNFSGINIGVNNLPKPVASVVAFPNPAFDILHFEMKWNAPVKATLSIHDINGRLLFNSPIIADKQSVDISSLSNGNYFYELNDEKGTTLYSGKFSVNR